MATEVILPKVDMDMATGKISAWHVKEGDTVKKGQPLFEIETDKAAMEVEAPASGIVRALAEVAKDIPVGQAVAFILTEGEALNAPPAVLKAPSPTATPLPPTSTPDPALRGPHEPASGVLRATPLARRLARQQGIALSTLQGSGPHGRITSKDVVAPISAAQMPAANGAVLKPLDNMRRTIAQRLQHSKQTIPHFYLSVSCTLDTLLALREKLNTLAPKSADGAPLWKLSVNDFIVKALAQALQSVPAANVTWGDAGPMQHMASDVGVAIAVDGGLFTPVVRNANSKSLSQISSEVKDFAARAKLRKLRPDEYQGGTTTVSNLGMYGIEEFSAIINPPQASILAVGAALPQFIPVGNLPVLKTIMKATLSCDHRAIDGAVGAEFLQAFKQHIEEPALTLV